MNYTIIEDHVNGILRAISTSEKNLIGEAGCPKFFEGSLRLLGEKFKAPVAVDLVIQLCSSFNTMTSDIKRSLDSVAKVVTDGANAYYAEYAKGQVTISKPESPDRYVLQSTKIDTVEPGEGGNAGNLVLPDSTTTKLIFSSFSEVKTTMLTAINSLKAATSMYSRAFYGTGQEELTTSCELISSQINKVFTNLETAYSNALEKAGSSVEQSAARTKSSFTVGE